MTASIALAVIAIGCLLGSWPAVSFLMTWSTYGRHERSMAGDQPQPGDPLVDVPADEMGVWLTVEQADELDCLAAETWPRNEYFAIVEEHVRGEAS
jgi:hypothetical protein